MSKISYMTESLTRDLIARLMEEQGMAMRQAMDVVYKSKTFSALANPETGLYFQSAPYVYEELEKELAEKAIDSERQLTT